MFLNLCPGNLQHLAVFLRIFSWKLAVFCSKVDGTDLSDLDMLSLGRAAAPLGREAASLGRPTADSFDGMEDRFTASVGLVGFAVSFEGAGVTGFLTPVTGVLKVARRGCVDGCPRVEKHARKAVD